MLQDTQFPAYRELFSHAEPICRYHSPDPHSLEIGAFWSDAGSG